MEKKIDRRIRKTKQQLQEGFIQLRKTKSIKDITVKELCELTDLNRGTFYLHYKDIYDIPSDTLLHIYETAKKLMDMLREKLGCDGFTLLQNNGSIQEVKHYHLHIKPHYKNNHPVKLVKDTNLIKDPKEIYSKIKEA